MKKEADRLAKMEKEKAKRAEEERIEKEKAEAKEKANAQQMPAMGMMPMMGMQAMQPPTDKSDPNYAYQQGMFEQMQQYQVQMQMQY